MHANICMNIFAFAHRKACLCALLLPANFFCFSFANSTMFSSILVFFILLFTCLLSLSLLLCLMFSLECASAAMQQMTFASVIAFLIVAVFVVVQLQLLSRSMFNVNVALDSTVDWRLPTVNSFLQQAKPQRVCVFTLKFKSLLRSMLLYHTTNWEWGNIRYLLADVICCLTYEYFHRELN